MMLTKSHHLHRCCRIHHRHCPLSDYYHFFRFHCHLCHHYLCYHYFGDPYHHHNLCDPRSRHNLCIIFLIIIVVSIIIIVITISIVIAVIIMVIPPRSSRSILFSFCLLLSLLCHNCCNSFRNSTILCIVVASHRDSFPGLHV